MGKRDQGMGKKGKERRREGGKEQGEWERKK
jgi:hypothetical protein